MLGVNFTLDTEKWLEKERDDGLGTLPKLVRNQLVTSFRWVFQTGGFPPKGPLLLLLLLHASDIIGPRPPGPEA